MRRGALPHAMAGGQRQDPEAWSQVDVGDSAEGEGVYSKVVQYVTTVFVVYSLPSIPQTVF